jgi:hypothetical protein
VGQAQVHRRGSGPAQRGTEISAEYRWISFGIIVPFEIDPPILGIIDETSIK